MIYRFLILFSLLLISFHSISQTPKVAAKPVPPKLVVGIVVDQMRYDYIYKYWDKFGSSGFKRLMSEGFSCSNTSFNYVPTYTGPGHASIYTGATPSVHGIVGNDWYLGNGKDMYCTYDASVKSVGSDGNAGHMSPRNMLSTSVADELRLSNGKRSKVIGIALKDRGAILPAGHTANAAYWYEGTTGNWITSTHYMKELPSWVAEFNKKELAKKYMSTPWTTLLPIEKYTESLPDNNPYEHTFKGKSEPVFPYDLPALMEKNGGLGLIRSTPFGNSLTKDFALEAIKSENLGKGQYTDLISISFSSTDYIGHAMGIHAVELQDTYLRLDKDIAELLSFLDSWVGKQNTLVFLTADHGAVEVPAYLYDNGVPAGYLNPYAVIDSLKKSFLKLYNDSLIEEYTNQQVYINDEAVTKAGLKMTDIENLVGNALMKVSGVAGYATATQLQNNQFDHGVKHRIQMGYYPKRCGDVFLVLDPAWVEFSRKGTTHGAPYTYDTHVPLLWYGWKIKTGTSSVPVDITDIAPTVSTFLNIPFPNGSIGNPIQGLVK